MSGVAEEIVVSESGYEFPVADLLTGRGAIFGKSGSGKSNTTTVVAEELLAQSLPLLIVDQDGEYHGLKSEYDLLHVGAGEDCDETVGADDGEYVADRALDETLPVVLDVSGFVDEETARELVYGVVRRLFARENEVQKPFLLVVEEIHEYVPEQGGLDDLGEMLVRVAKRGRKRGLGICGVSQRPASVDKDFITQCDWIVWHRLTWRNDTRAVGRILGSEYADRVQDLADGEAFVMADWAESVDRVRFRRKRTEDAGATPGLDQFDHAVADGDGGSSSGSDSGPRYDPSLGPGSTSDSGPDPNPTSDAAPDRSDAIIEPADRSEPTTLYDPDTPDRSGPTDPPGVVTDDVANQGNPVWELGQMFVYLFGTIAYGVVNAVRRIVPWISPRRRRDDPIAIPSSGSIDWKRTSVLMVLVNLLLLALVGYLLVIGSG